MGTSPQSALVRGYGEAVRNSPDDERKKIGLIARLMQHYWQPGMSEAERKWQAVDWKIDLQPFSEFTVARACDRYRGDPKNRQRPLPCDIVLICNRIMDENRLKALPPPPKRARRFEFTDEELAERREYASLRGFHDWQAFLSAVEVGLESIQPFLAWSNARRGLPEPVYGFKTL